jgi:2-isopropylmalate synthase
LIVAEPGTQRTDFELSTLHVFSDSMAAPQPRGCSNASVAIRNSSADVLYASAAGNGPIDAVFSAIQKITGIECNLVDYRVRMVVQEKQVLAEASVKLEYSGRKSFGRALATDILVASANAFLTAFNRLRVPVVRGGSKDTTK